jgi:hypothetical protein
MKLLDEIRLPKNDALIYIKSLISIAKSNGTFDKDEKEFVMYNAELQGIEIDNDMLSQNHSLDDLGVDSLSDGIKKLIIRDCITLGYIDGDYCDEERKIVSEICAKFQLDKNTPEIIEKWLNSLWAIIKDGNKIFL